MPSPKELLCGVSSLSPPAHRPSCPLLCAQCRLLQGWHGDGAAQGTSLVPVRPSRGVPAGYTPLVVPIPETAAMGYLGHSKAWMGTGLAAPGSTVGARELAWASLGTS